jgi:preprotein translocase subunit SecY
MNAFLNMFKIPELRKRLLYTLGMLAVYRVGIFITTPGVDRNVMRDIMDTQSGSFLGLFNLFSGGALEQLSVFALGITPYVTASIVLTLLSAVVPQLEELRQEGESGQRKLNQYTRYGTIVLSAVQSTGIALFLEGLNNSQGQFGDVVANPGWGFRLITCISLTTGTAFIMWLGEQIIVVRLPEALFHTSQQVKIGQIQPISLLFVLATVLVIIALIVFFERAQRRIPIQYAKRMVGRKMYGGQASHLPLKVNAAGVIPPIFASSLLMFPGTLAGFNVPYMDKLQQIIVPGDWRYTMVYVVLIVFFAFFYTAIQFQPVQVADNLKKQNAFIPGIRPGKATADFIDNVMTRITFCGAMYMALVCTVPDFLRIMFKVPFHFGGTSIMIVVGVALDLVQQIESHLITRHYEGLTGPRGPRIRGRNG